MNYFPFHIGDYRAATAHLTNDEDLAYRRLLEMYYDTEQPIPVETQWVSRRLRMASEVIQVVLDDFFVRTDDGWRNDRCDQEIAAYHRNAEKNRENGKRGGRPKAAPALEDNPLGYQSVSDGLPVETHSEANQEPRTKNQEPRTKDQKQKAPGKPVKFDPMSTLIELGVSENVAADWLTIRKTKKAAVTATAIAIIVKEAGKAGVSMQTALETCCQRGWAGYESKWIEGANGAPNARASPAGYAQQRDEGRARVSEILTGRGRNERTNTTERDITGEAFRVA